VIDHGRVIAEGTGDELKDRAGGAFVQVRVPERGERERALAVLAGVDGHRAERGAQDDVVVLQASGDGVALLADAAQALRAAGVTVSELALQRPTLDEVFLQLTGERPRDERSEEEPEEEAVRASAATTAAGPVSPRTSPAA